MNSLSESADYDPQSSAISSAYVSLFNDYVRKDLKYGDGQTYLPMALFGSAQWDFKHAGNPVAVNVANDLAEAMKTIPASALWSTAATTISPRPSSRRVRGKAPPHPQFPRQKHRVRLYESGHMVYVRDESLKQLHDRVSAFIKSTLTTK